MILYRSKSCVCYLGGGGGGISLLIWRRLVVGIKLNYLMICYRSTFLSFENFENKIKCTL